MAVRRFGNFDYEFSTFLMAFGCNYSGFFRCVCVGGVYFILVFKNNSRLWPKYVAQDIGNKTQPFGSKGHN